jgi:hypothetical protein
LTNKLFDIAVIIHDSVFINKYIDFNVDKYKFLWDFTHEWDNRGKEIRMLSVFNDKSLIDFYNNKNAWVGCFGAMSVITHDYLVYINNKYPIEKLLNLVLNRNDRCCWERVLACLLQINCPLPSLLGNIHKYCKWGIEYKDKYLFNDLPIFKVWTGR